MPDRNVPLADLAQSNDVAGLVWALRNLSARAARDQDPIVVELLSHKSVAVREAAAEAARHLDTPAARDRLMELSDKINEINRRVRQEAVRSLAFFSGPEVEAALETALGDPALNVREDAKESLRRIREQ